MKTKKILLNLLKCTIISILGISFCFALQEYNISVDNLFLVLVITDIFIVLETKEVKYGICGALLCGLLYEFFLVEPIFSIRAINLSIILNLVIYMVVCVFVCILMYTIQLQIQKFKKEEELLNSSYLVSTQLLNCKNVEDIAICGQNALNKFLNKDVVIGIKQKKHIAYYKNFNYDISNDETQINYALSYNLICGFNENKFDQLPYKIYPLKSKKSIFGVLLIDCTNGDLTKNEKTFIKNHISNILIALEREKFQDKNQDAKEQIESHKFKEMLMKDISSDIRTPITYNNNIFEKIITSYNLLQKDELYELLIQIKSNNDTIKKCADSLYDFINEQNVLNYEKVNLKDLINECIYNDKIMLETRTEFHINADKKILSKAFSNLINYQTQYRTSTTYLKISVIDDNTNILIQFEDDGGILSQESLAQIFENNDKLISLNIDMELCKSIFEIHDFKIKAFSTDNGLMIKIFVAK